MQNQILRLQAFQGCLMNLYPVAYLNTTNIHDEMGIYGDTFGKGLSAIFPKKKAARWLL
jgi:hypothetical protein